MNTNRRSHPVQLKRPETDQVWKWYQYINRAWMKYLSPSEFMLLLFIVDRTLGWQKDSEVITRRQMREGVITREKQEVVHRGTALSSSTIDTTLNRLVMKGAITRWPVRMGTNVFAAFSVNRDWKPELQIERSKLAVARDKEQKQMRQQLFRR